MTTDLSVKISVEEFQFVCKAILETKPSLFRTQELPVMDDSAAYHLVSTFMDYPEMLIDDLIIFKTVHGTKPLFEALLTIIREQS